MFPILVIVLSASILAIVAVACFMFCNVALEGPPAPKSTTTAKQWQPPADGDNTLLQWASRTAASLTKSKLMTSSSSTAATELAEELYGGVEHARAQLTPDVSQCPASCHDPISVSAPEALAIADRIRTHLTTADGARIRDEAARNVDLAHQEGADKLKCPLFTNDGTCAAYPLRPLACRTECPVRGGDDAAAAEDRVAPSLVRGVRQGLTEGLTQAGVDANRYELNSVLLKALDAPDVSDRWASGEAVFASCRRLD